MPFTVDRAAILGALNHLARIVERRTTIAILSYLRFAPDPADGRLLLTATDLDIDAIAKIPCDGAVAVFTAPAHVLHDIVRKLPDGARISFDADAGAGKVAIKSGRARFSLSTLPADEWPEQPGPQEPVRFAMPANMLARLFGRAQFAISTEETRHYLNGVYFHAGPAAPGDDVNAMIAVATDGHRLVRLHCPMMGGAADMPAVIVPRKAVAEIVRLAEAAGQNESVAIEVAAARARFDFGAVALTTKTIDGTFPDYARVIPAADVVAAPVRLPRETLARAADRVATIASERGRAVKLEVEAGLCRLTAVNPNMGEAREEIECAWAGAPQQTGFNSAYLAQVLANLGGADVELRQADSGSPCRVSDPVDSSAVIVLMPMRV